MPDDDTEARFTRLEHEVVQLRTQGRNALRETKMTHSGRHVVPSLRILIQNVTPYLTSEYGDAMRRVIFLRSYDFHWVAPYLGRMQISGDIEAKLFYTDGDCGPGDFPGNSERLDPQVSCDELVTRILAWDADGVISISWPDQNSIRDAIVGDNLAHHGIPMVMHKSEVTRRLSNKWETKEVARRFALETPEGILLDGDVLNGRGFPIPAYRSMVERRAAVLGFPLLVKPLWGYGTHDIRLIGTESDLVSYLRDPYDGNAILERCVRGELCSVEIVGRDGSYVIQPLIWMGTTGGAPPLSADRFRFSAPRRQADADFIPVAQRLRTMCTELGINGAVNVDMIYSKNTYQVIEINPRTSGITTLSIASSGCNTFECLLDMLLGNWSAERARSLERRIRCALQFPVTHLDKKLVQAVEREIGLVRVRSFMLLGRRFDELTIPCEFADSPGLGNRIASLHSRFDFLTPAIGKKIDVALDSIFREFAAIKAT